MAISATSIRSFVPERKRTRGGRPSRSVKLSRSPGPDKSPRGPRGRLDRALARRTDRVTRERCDSPERPPRAIPETRHPPEGSTEKRSTDSDPAAHQPQEQPAAERDGQIVVEGDGSQLEER